MQVGGSVDKKDVDRDGEKGEEGEEGRALQPLSGKEGLAYGEPGRAELGGRGGGEGEKLGRVRFGFSEPADPGGWEIERCGSSVHCDWIEQYHGKRRGCCC